MNHIALTLCLLLAPFFFQGGAYAQKANPVECASCHKAGAKVMPESHKNYALDKTGTCFACHKPGGKAQPLGEKIHRAHLNKSAATMNNCLSCHLTDKDGDVSFPSYPQMKASKERMAAVPPFFSSWTNSKFLDQGHRQKGIYCTGCHADYLDEYAADDTQAACVGCHGDYAEMAKKTANTKFKHNPHESHYVDLKCSSCHHSHKAFEDSCGKCHPFGYKMPEKK